MSRPRLVEEGVPIGSTNHTFQDEDCMHTSTDMDLEVNTSTAALDRPTNHMSSLTSAAGGEVRIPRTPSQPRRTTFRTVIGGDHCDSHASRTSSWYHPPADDYPTNAMVAPTALGNRPYRVETHPEVEKMEGVEDHGVKHPMVVLDGANIAYGYSTINNIGQQQQQRNRANMKGILVAAQYWQQRSCRVLVVLPQPWFNRSENMDILRAIKDLLVAAPSRDDDDAYALHIAMLENTRAAHRPNMQGPAYVVSNDMFRDAIQRDSQGQLSEWLNVGIPGHKELGKGRISYTFADMKRLDDHGDPELDFVPNPRHPLVIWAEQQQQQQR